MTTDYIIVGQGLCGTWLSYYLMEAGKRVVVIDEGDEHTASNVASGMINPVTGRRVVKTWRIDELLPFAKSAYQMFGSHSGEELVQETTVINFHTTPQMVLAYQERLSEQAEFLYPLADLSQWDQFFRFSFSATGVAPVLLIDIQKTLRLQRLRLQAEHAFLQEKFELENCTITPEKVVYKEIEADKILFCDGIAGSENPFFRQLPYSANKGEALIVSIPDLPGKHIYKHRFSLVPWKGVHWVGSTYEWDFENPLPTEGFRTQCEKFLHEFIKLPFQVLDHLAAVRPASVDRRPFVGLHPAMPSLGIFNGMGTKGCSLAPFFGKHFSDHLVQGSAISPEVNVKRFVKLLHRK